MSVIVETSLGSLTIDLFTDEAPKAALNFIKLCKVKYYNNCIFHNIQHDYLVQTGDPTATGRGGQSIYGLLYGEQANFFPDEIHPSLRHKEIGMVSMANKGANQNASQFFITTGSDLDSLDEKHTIFGQVVEGFETLNAINNAYCDKDGRPLQVIRIRHAIILDDPFPDPAGLQIPSESPLPIVDAPKGLLSEDAVAKVKDKKLEEEEMEQLREELEKKQASTRAEVLEILGDIPDAEIKPDRAVLFVCQLNPLTTDEDLELIFSRFGKITSCEILKDKKTGDSLQYAFIEFDNEKSAEEAFFKMNKVLIDDRRIHVDFSQSVSRAEFATAGGWRQYYQNKAKNLLGDSKEPRAGGRGVGRGGSSNLPLKRGRYDQMGGRNDYDYVHEHDRAAKRSRHDDDYRNSRDRDRRSHSRERERSREMERDRRSRDYDRDRRSRDHDRDRRRDYGNDDRRERQRDRR